LAPLKPGDGVVFDAADWRSPEEPEEGGRIFEVLPRGGSIELRFANRALDRARIRRGDLVWRTNDPDLEKRIRALPAETAAGRCARHRAGRRAAGCCVGSGRGSGDGGVRWAARAARATGRSIADLLREILAAGQHAVPACRLELEVEGAPFAPASLLNQVRRDAVERLEAAAAAPRRTEIHDPMVTLDEIVSGKLARGSACPPLPDQSGAGASACQLDRSPACICWCARRSSSPPPSSFARPASRSITSISTASSPRSNACARPA
jgi:U32 family peptidase